MIEGYSFGKIIVDGREYHQDVILYPGRIDANWWRKEGHRVCPDDIKEILEEKIELLIVGKGNPGLMSVLDETKDVLFSHGIVLIEESTALAVKRFNELKDKKRVVAALHLTC